MSADIITLSSDEEDCEPPPKKRIKPTSLDEVSITLTAVNKSKDLEDVVILSDEESDVTEVIIKDSEILEDAVRDADVELSVTIKDDENDPITFIEPKLDVVENDKDEKNTEHKEENKDKCTVIVDEDNSIDSAGKENQYEDSTLLPFNDSDDASTSSNNKLFEFLNVCEESISKSRYEHLKEKQFPNLRKYYKKCSAKLFESVNFLKLIDDNIERAQKSPASAVISFDEVFRYVRGLVEAESIDVSEEDRWKLKKLEKTIKLLVARIKHLENAEIDFEAEEDSSYLQLDRYINRLNKVYKKYCKLLKKNPYSGRITYEKLDFVDSEYNEINRAISKKYKNNKKFPSYIEMEEYIKKIVSEYNLNLSESRIKNESVRCFEKLGELLQSRRKKELYDAHYLYIRDSEDPATTDTSLESTLKKNFCDGQIKIEKLCEDYVTKEKLGQEVELSEEDSDKSNYVDSENEEISVIKD